MKQTRKFLILWDTKQRESKAEVPEGVVAVIELLNWRCIDKLYVKRASLKVLQNDCFEAAARGIPIMRLSVRT